MFTMSPFAFSKKTRDPQIFESTYLSNKVDERWHEGVGILRSRQEIAHFWRAVLSYVARALEKNYQKSINIK